MGYYYPMPREFLTATEEQCRRALHTSRLTKLWCAIYTKEEAERAIADHGGGFLEHHPGHMLDYVYDEVFG